MRPGREHPDAVAVGIETEERVAEIHPGRGLRDSHAAVAPLRMSRIDRGVKIAQAPTRMDFGYTFLGLDPDGHRVRVFAPGAR